MMNHSITLITSPVFHNPQEEALSSTQTSSMLTISRRKRQWRPRRAVVVVTAAIAAAVLVAVSTTSVTTVAAFHTALPFAISPPTTTSRQSSYSSSSTFLQAIAAEQQEQALLLQASTSRQQQQRQQRHERSLQNRNTLERLYSLPVLIVEDRQPEDESLRFIEDMEQQQQQQQQHQRHQQQQVAGRMKIKKQTTSTIPVSTTTTKTMPSLGKVKVVKGRKTDRERILRSMKTTPLAMKSRSHRSLTMKNSNATAAVATTTTATTAAPVIASTLEDAASSATIQFRGLSTTSYRGNRKQSPLPPAAAAAFKKSRPTITSNTTMTMAAATTTTTRRGTRSSTMPGLAIQSDKQRAFRDGIRIAEQQSGRKFVDTPELRQSRRRINGENMYKNSASVPDSLAQFAHEIHQEGRITRQEEIALGTTVQEAIRLHRNLQALREQLCREPTDDEWCAAAGKINTQAIREAIEDGLEAKNKLVTSNLRMVQSVVNTYIRNGLSAQYNAGDLMQEGIMALIRAAEKFEPDRGWKFSTYAMYWVRASVKRSQIYQSRVVSVPQRLYESHKRLLRVGKELEVALGRKPTNQELGEAVDMSAEQVKRCFTAMEQRCYSLDKEINNSKKPQTSDGNKNRLIDILDYKSPDDDIQRMHFIREDIIETLHRQLSPEEVELLLFRYGLKDLPGGTKKLGSGCQPTIAELSRAVGQKPDRVRRIINRALHQLRSVQSGEWLAFERELMR